MRKIMAITMLLVTLLASTCFAADWYWLVSTDTASFYVDKNSGQWNGLRLNCSEKTIFDDGNYALYDITYDYSDSHRIKRRQNFIWVYNADGSYIGSDRGYEWTIIPPESVGEEIAHKVFFLFKSRIK